MMAAPTFLQTLKVEVARMQAARPDKEGDIARAHALIMQGMVQPSGDDPALARVLSSDGSTWYAVNGTCSCPAGQHGKACKHLQAWKLYQHISKKMVPATSEATQASALPEAPASANLRVMIGGHETMITLRDAVETRLLDRLHTLLKRQ